MFLLGIGIMSAALSSSDCLHELSSAIVKEQRKNVL